MVTFRGSGKMKRVVERFGSLVLSTAGTEPCRLGPGGRTRVRGGN